MGITREQYEAAIPKCCAYQTMEAHEHINLCCGIISAIDKGKEVNCSRCSENTTNSTKQEESCVNY